jgi:hypothetical protein
LVLQPQEATQIANIEKSVSIPVLPMTPDYSFGVRRTQFPRIVLSSSSMRRFHDFLKRNRQAFRGMAVRWMGVLDGC